MAKHKGPWVLEIDIESAPAKAYIWDLKTRYVPVSQIEEPGYTLCFAAKWQHQKKVMFYSLWTHTHEEMVQAAWDLLDKADAVVHYNGNNYDIPVLNRDFLLMRLGPPSPAQHIDLYTTAKQFRFMSKSMNFICEQLGLRVKVDHKGMPLWTGCMRGEPQDQALMRRYNIGDIKMLEELYEELTPWIKTTINVAHWMEPEYVDGEPKLRCRCGSTNLRFKGYKRNTALQYKQYHCQDCGFYPRERFCDKPARKDTTV